MSDPSPGWTNWPTETSPLLNPGLKGPRHAKDAFATDDYNVMLVANKFQTGSTSRCWWRCMWTNACRGWRRCRPCHGSTARPGQDQTFVIDFANGAEEIVEAFEPYYTATTLADVTDPNIVHEVMNKLDAAAIYQEAGSMDWSPTPSQEGQQRPDQSG